VVTDAGGTLSERPDVRVRAAAVNMVFVRAAEGQAAGRPFFWYFSLSAKEKYEQKIISPCSVTILGHAKNGYEKIF
jgi:hypothetical protein